jgi:Putative GTPase activating protein for Arf
MATYSTQSSGNLRDDGNYTAAGKGQVCIPTTEKNLQFRKLKAVTTANQVCFDCPATRPTWASVTYGTFVMWVGAGYNCMTPTKSGCTTFGTILIGTTACCVCSLFLFLSFCNIYTGIFLCLDCSATHRSLGVHTTFVRSVDLDEWTQRQLDAMRLGGNSAASTYFRKHGISDGHQKIEKKYTSKAAMSYRTVLAKLVDAEATKRGEEGMSTLTTEHDSTNGSLLLESLNRVDQQELENAMKIKSTQQQQPITAAVSKAIPVGQLPGARGRLLTPPSSGNAPSLQPSVLRKPASSGNINLLKKKPTGAKSLTLKMNSNKLTTAASSTSGAATATSIAHDDGGLEDIETTEQKREDAEKEEAAAAAAAGTVEAQQVQLASLQLEETATAPTTITSTNGIPATMPAHLSPNNQAPKQSLADSIAKMKAQNGDFFGSF